MGIRVLLCERDLAYDFICDGQWQEAQYPNGFEDNKGVSMKLVILILLLTSCANVTLSRLVEYMEAESLTVEFEPVEREIGHWDNSYKPPGITTDSWSIQFDTRPSTITCIMGNMSADEISILWLESYVIYPSGKKYPLISEAYKKNPKRPKVIPPGEDVWIRWQIKDVITDDITWGKLGIHWILEVAGVRQPVTFWFWVKKNRST